MLVYQAVGEVLTRVGVDTVFGLMGDGNLRYVNDMTDRHGVRYYAARHECTAVAMADAYARLTHRLGVATVTQGPGLTNAVTGLVEAVKARTPLLLLTGDVAGKEPPSNQEIDQGALLRSLGVAVQPVRSVETFVSDCMRAVRLAVLESRPVALPIPNRLQEAECPDAGLKDAGLPDDPATRPEAAAVARAADLLQAAHRPLILAGRGALRAGAGPALRALAERTGALVTTSVQAKGLFAGDPYDLGVAGGFASSLAVELARQADVVLVAGASLTHWTLRHGRFLSEQAEIVDCDTDPNAIGARRPAAVALVGDALVTVRELEAELARRGHAATGCRTPEVAAELAAYRPESEFAERSEGGRLDPRTLTIALNRVLPEARTVVVDSGHFQGFPPIYLDVPDADGFCFSQDFQSLSIGIGSALGAAVARPDRLAVHTIGDGGLMMCLGDLETAVRYQLPLLVVVYNDAAYGAEVHLLENLGWPTRHAFFGETDFAAIARSLGGSGCTVRELGDLDQLAGWLAAPSGLMVADCKVNPWVRAGWFDEMFGGTKASATTG